MIVSRIIYGNAIGREGSGWRVGNSSPVISEQDLVLFKDLCRPLYERISMETPRIFFGKRAGKSLFLGCGIDYGKDTTGRPGGWWFFGGIIKDQKIGLESALELSQILFDGCESWLDEQQPLVPKGMDFPGSRKPLVQDFWADFLSDARECQQVISKSSIKANSYCFPTQSPVSGFDVCVPSERGNPVVQSPNKRKPLVISWGLVVLLAITLLGSAVFFGSSVRDKNSKIGKMDKRIERQVQEIDGLRGMVEGLEGEKKGLEEETRKKEKIIKDQIVMLSRNDDLIETMKVNATKGVTDENRQLKSENQTLKKDSKALGLIRIILKTLDDDKQTSHGEEENQNAETNPVSQEKANPSKSTFKKIIQKLPGLGKQEPDP